MSFSVSVNPWVCHAKYSEGLWPTTWQMKPYSTLEKEGKAQSGHDPIDRNSFPELPLINYTTQYGLGCFEGIKAYPQQDGSLRIFRSDKSGERMKRSMEGLMMPGFPVDKYVETITKLCKQNLEFSPSYQPEWEANNFGAAGSLYIRPFSYTEAGIGVNISFNPWVVFVTTNVGSYFTNNEQARGTTVLTCRATPGGTGSLKCASNYVISAIEREKALRNGFMEVVFLDAFTKTSIEEGSSSNFFAVMKDGTLVTPSLGDTVLAGITRDSVCILAKDQGIRVEERELPLQEVLENAKEVFLTGTAAGISHLSSLTHQGKEYTFGDGTIGELTLSLKKTLKGIQYGLLEDKYGWTIPVHP